MNTSSIRLKQALQTYGQEQHSTLRGYVIGFGLSMALTIEAFLVVSTHAFHHGGGLAAILSLAILQLLVQLFYFLHLDQAFQAPWNIIALLFTGMVVAIVVFGSVWIMHHLDYNMHSPSATDKYIQQEERISR